MCLEVRKGNQIMSESRAQNQSGVAELEYEDKLAQAQPDLWDSLMEMPAKIEFLKSALASQQITLLLQITLAAMLFVVGITVVILSFVSPGLILAESLKTGQMLGGIMVVASGVIPLLFSRGDEIIALRCLLHSYQHQQVGGLSPDAKLDQYFDQYFAKVRGD